jgi:GTP cyclohydrolase II
MDERRGGAQMRTKHWDKDAAVAGAEIRSEIEIPIMGGRFRSRFFTFHGLIDHEEHVAIGLGQWSSAEVPLVRLHSECLTGDVFGSRKCDCGQQLEEAIPRIHAAGGFLLYLRQEGRGIGLYNKLDAYRLQASGMDTFQANRALGFDDDMRDYAVAAQMLHALGAAKIRLLSNNSDKVRQLRDHGIEVVERVDTTIHCNADNRAYLASKATIGGHHIRIEEVLK